MILMNDFKAEPQEMRDAMLGAARRVLESGWYVLGSEVEKFERQWAGLCGTQHGIGVANGMDAIEIALRALNIGPGDEVITTPMTAFATVLAIIRAGAVPVLADIEPDSALLSMQSASRCLSARTKAVLLVHLYGQIRDIEVWRAFCAERRIHLIEDCAQAHLAASGGKAAGSFGIAGAYSFYPTKNLGAPGDAGMLVTNDGEMSKRASQLRNYGQSVRYYHPVLGMNSRLDELHAAMLSEKLRWLPEATRRRQEIARRYRAGMNNPHITQLAAPQQPEAHVFHLYVVLCAHREELAAHLKAAQIQSLIHYPVPVHKQDSCADIRRDPHGLPYTEAFAQVCLSLPCHPQMSDDAVERVVCAVNEFKAG